MSVKEAGAAGYPPAAIRAAGYSEEEIISALGELKESGWSPAQASAAGFTIPEIEQVYSEGDVEGLLIDAKIGGMTAEEASDAGYSPAQMEQAGYTPQEMGALLAEEKE